MTTTIKVFFINPENLKIISFENIIDNSLSLKVVSLNDK
jgi:hypothetical protein